MKPILVDQLPGAQPLFGIKRHEQPTFSMPWHVHRFFELTLILEGRGTRIVGDSIGGFAPGDLVLLGPHLPHVWKDDPQQPHPAATAVTAQFTDRFPTADFLQLDAMRPVAQVLRQAGRGIRLRAGLKERTRARMLSLTQESSTRQVLTLLEILADVAASPDTRLLASSGYQPPEPRDLARWSTIQQHVLDHFRTPISGAALARVAGMHPSSLGRYIKRMSGLTFTQYVNQIRIGHACQLLATDHAAMVEICYASGFQNLSHFNRCFRRAKGCPPSAYRRAIQQATESR